MNYTKYELISTLVAALLFLSACNDGGVVDNKKHVGRINSLLNTKMISI